MTEKFCTALVQAREHSPFSLHEVTEIFGKLREASDIGEFWTEQLLATIARSYPSETVHFLLERISQERSISYYPLPPSGFRHEFRAALGEHVSRAELDRIWAYANRYPKRASGWSALFWITAQDEEQALKFTERKVRRPTKQGLRILGKLFVGGRDGALLSRPTLAATILERAYAIDEAYGDSIYADLLWSMRPKHISAAMGQSVPILVTTKQQAEVAFEAVRNSPHARRLFAALRDRCEAENMEHLVKSEEMDA